ncbi:MAG: 6-phosphogluconolactonase [Deltaproteobacteria bacterium]|nr:6-phosphogluconolactonase [Deltaproteobacteria bacterium]
MAHMVNGNKEVLVFADYAQMAAFAVEKWGEIAADAIKRKDWLAAALSGGRTPVGFYQKLSQYKKNIAWDKTHIFLADERFVPFDNEASNYRLIEENLLSRVDIPMENVHPVSTQEATAELAANSYEKHVRDFFKLGASESPAFDLIMLGIGEDGHTASLFPETLSLTEKNRLVIAVKSEKLSNERISLSLHVINRARNIIFLVSGKKKARIIKTILEENDDSLPAVRVKPSKGSLLFLLDKDAGGKLS